MLQPLAHPQYGSHERFWSLPEGRPLTTDYVYGFFRDALWEAGISHGGRARGRGSMTCEMPPFRKSRPSRRVAGRGPAGARKVGISERAAFLRKLRRRSFLRHTFLTVAARNGVHPSVMQHLAGHATSRITMDIYTHVNMEQKRAAMDAMQGAFSVAPKEHAA